MRARTSGNPSLNVIGWKMILCSLTPRGGVSMVIRLEPDFRPMPGRGIKPL
jgi:hypothetical protein